MRRLVFDADHETYRDAVRTFVAREVTPNLARWDTERIVDRRLWRAAGTQGMIGLAVEQQFGGAGQRDYRYRYVVCEELARVGAAALITGFGVQDDTVIPYLADLGTPQQKATWLCGLASGDLIGAIAITEPDAGSDLRGLRTTARPDGDSWIIDGQKTFISNGSQCDLVVVVARSDDARFTLFVVEDGVAGFTRGRKLDKVGLHAQDTAELSFASVRVPVSHVLGTPGQGLAQLMTRLPRERLAIAIGAVSMASAVFTEACDYVFRRKAFGQPVGDFQHVRFQLADMATELDVARAYVDRAVLALNDDDLSAVDAAKAKWWATELQKSVVDRCVQLFGGYGYMLEQPVARAYIDARVQTIYGGTTEIMKEIIGRDIAAAYR